MPKLRLLCVTVGLLAVIALLGLGGLALVSQARADQATTSPLTIEEHAIVSQEVDAPEHFDYLLRIPAGVLDLRRPWRDAPRGQTAPPPQTGGRRSDAAC